MYGKGRGGPRDYVQAYAWTNLAASQGNKNAEKFRASVERGMTSAQVAKAQKLSKELFERLKK
jgi:TPR repeat protein